MKPNDIRDKCFYDSPSDLPSQEYNLCSICKRNIEGGISGWKNHHYSDKHGWFLQNLLESWLTALRPLLSWHRPLSLEQAINDKKKACTRIGAIQEAVIYNLMNSDDKLLLQIASSYRDHLSAQSFDCNFCQWRVDLIPSSEEDSNNTICSSVLAEDVFELALPRFWKHFSSEEHRKRVFDFWRHHHIEHHRKKNLERSSSDKLEYSRRGKKITFNPNFELFQAESFFLTALQLQSKLEDWVHLNKLLNDQNLILDEFLGTGSRKSTRIQTANEMNYETGCSIDSNSDTNYLFLSSVNSNSPQFSKNYVATRFLSGSLKYGSNKKKIAPWDKISHDKLSYACSQRLPAQNSLCDRDSASRSTLSKKRIGIAWSNAVCAALKESPYWTDEIPIETTPKKKSLPKKARRERVPQH